MKRKDLIRTIEKIGCVLIRHGGNHDWYQNTKTKMAQPVPRHREINEILAKHIINAILIFFASIVVKIYMGLT